MRRAFLLLTAYCLLLTAHSQAQAVVNRDRLSLLRDVGINAGSLTTGQVLRYSGSAWVNTTLGWSMISGTPTTLAGYGITDAQPALPSQSGHSGQFLSTNGSALSWAAAGANFDPHSPGAIGDTTPGTGAFTALVSDTALMGSGTVYIAENIFGFGQSAYISWAGTTLLSPVANTLALRNGTNGQTLDISRTFTDASNYSQLKIDVTGSTVAFGAEEAGTGVGTLTGYSFDGSLGIGTTTPYIDAGYKGIDIRGGSGGLMFFGTGSGSGGRTCYFVGETGRGRLGTAGNYHLEFWPGDSRKWVMTFDGLLAAGGLTSSFPALKRTGSDLEIVKADGTAADTALILSSPNGTRYRVSVANDGTLTTTAQ